MYKFISTPNGELEAAMRGAVILSTPLLNKGVAFILEERKQLGLSGLLPPAILTLKEQAHLAYEQYRYSPTT